MYKGNVKISSFGTDVPLGKDRREPGAFIGSETVLRHLKEGPPRRRVGFIVEGAPAREGAKIFDKDGNEEIGQSYLNYLSKCIIFADTCRVHVQESLPLASLHPLWERTLRWGMSRTVTTSEGPMCRSKCGRRSETQRWRRCHLPKRGITEVEPGELECRLGTRL